MKKLFVPMPLSEEIVLPKDSTHHLLTVFRHPVDEEFLVTGSDNRTGWFMITGVNDNGEGTAVLVRWVDSVDGLAQVALAQAYVKGEKLEWILQKATELNVHTVYTLPGKHSVAKYDDKKLNAKAQRWQKILQEASQQCGRQQLPIFQTATSIGAVIEAEQAQNTLLLVANETEDGTTIRDVLQKAVWADQADPRVLIFIGPEGGWSAEELAYFTENGVKSVSLGTTILRAETAAIASLAMINYELTM